MDQSCLKTTATLPSTIHNNRLQKLQIQYQINQKLKFQADYLNKLKDIKKEKTNHSLILLSLPGGSTANMAAPLPSWHFQALHHFS